jgi:hypothetical protein
MTLDTRAEESTYFFVKIWINKTANTYGPYLQLSQAVDILLNHSKIALPKKQNKRFSYKAEIQECIQAEDGTWNKVDTPIIENNCILRNQP